METAALDSVLKIEHLSKSFGRRKVIDDITFDVYAGEVFGFLGPNGAGKTTTIKMILGFLKPDEGAIFVNGLDLKKNYEKGMAELGGIVEIPEMYKDLSGYTNLKMYARLHDGVSKERIDEVTVMVGMQNRIHEKVKRYSLGMKQRLGLAQAVLHKPKILILDEPTNGLDPAGIKELRDILKYQAHKLGVAVFVSSHLLSEMELMCDRVGIIHNGELLGVKPIRELLDSVSGSPRYRFETKQTERAAEIIRQTEEYKDTIRAVTVDYVELEIPESMVAKINLILATNDIGIFGVNKVETSLEDAFLNITGGGGSIA
jgi:ABC-2 type transport system ATP-binding protein